MDNNAETASSATVNIRGGNIYIVCASGNKYKLTKVSNGFVPYLELTGCKVDTYSFIDTFTENKKTNNLIGGSKAVDNAVGVAIIFGVFFVFAAIASRNTKITDRLPFKFKKRKLATASSNKIISGIDGVEEEVPVVTFNDVEGLEELKEDVIGIVDCLKNPDKYKAVGAKPQKGVILYGPPGTGKTLFAKAIAGEAHVPFFKMNGSDFVEKYVGVGASRVRDLYKKARKSSPCIVFIDEIDAVAGARGRDENSEREQTINALLAELDGFDSSKGVVTICATNRLDMLDEAFKRAGRFDLKLAVGLPDKKSRKKILLIHGRNKKFAEDVSMDAVAEKTIGFSGAELENLLNEGAILAARRNRTEITMEDINDSYFKIIMNGNKKKRTEATETDKAVAWHEAGHTLATKLLTTDHVSSVTIVGSSSGAGGVTFRTPDEKNVLQSKKYLESLVQIMYAGRAAEEIYFKDQDSITTGASQDIKQATSILKEYCSAYGMGELGMLDLSQFKDDYGDVLAEATNKANMLYSRVLDLLKNNYSTLEDLAGALVKSETLQEKEMNYHV